MRNARIFLLMALALCLYGILLEAQETVSVNWPSRNTKQEGLRPVAAEIVMKGQGTAKVAPSGIFRREPKVQNIAATRLPFPVATSVKIDYPRKAIRKGWEGQTVVVAEILPDGSVGRTALAKSSGHEELDRAAREAIQTWRFETESEQDDTVPQYVDIPVTFKLEDN